MRIPVDPDYLVDPHVIKVSTDSVEAVILFFFIDQISIEMNLTK